MAQDHVREARAYVQRLRAEGRSDQQIRTELLAAGWQDQQVERLLVAHATSRVRRTRRSEDGFARPEPAHEPAPDAARVGWVTMEEPQPQAAPAPTNDAADEGWSLPGDGGDQESPEEFKPHLHIPKPLPRIEVLPERPFALSVLVVLVSGSALLGLAGAGMLDFGSVAVLSGDTSSYVDANAGAKMLGLAIGIAVVYIGVLTVSSFLWKGCAWARFVMIILIALNVLLPFIGGFVAFGFGSVIMSLMFLRILFLDDVESFCCR